MTWNSNPKVRQLADYAKQHSFKQAVVIGIREDGKYEVISCGKNRRECDNAKLLNDQLSSAIDSGEISVFED